jgi:hypothetical protein
VSAIRGEGQTTFGIIVETASLNSAQEGFLLHFTVRKPVSVLVDERFVPITGASGTPVELFLAGIREVDSEKQVDLGAHMDGLF